MRHKSMLKCLLKSATSLYVSPSKVKIMSTNLKKYGRNMAIFTLQNQKLKAGHKFITTEATQLGSVELEPPKFTMTGLRKPWAMRSKAAPSLFSGLVHRAATNPLEEWPTGSSKSDIVIFSQQICLPSC